MGTFDLKLLRSTEVEYIAREGYGIVTMLQLSCAIVRAAHLGKLQNLDFSFDKRHSTTLYDWPTSSDVLKEVAALEEILLSTPSKPTLTINIPSLTHKHAELILETARKLFPRVDQAGLLFMTPTRE